MDVVLTEDQLRSIANIIFCHDDENQAGGAMYTDREDIDILRPLVEGMEYKPRWM